MNGIIAYFHNSKKMKYPLDPEIKALFMDYLSEKMTLPQKKEINNEN